MTNDDEGSLDSNGEKQMGPPSKYKPEVVDKLLAAISEGLTQTQAASVAGIHRDTLITWKQKYPDFAKQLDQAREQCREKMLGIIKAAAESGEWKAAECHLRMSFFPQYT